MRWLLPWRVAVEGRARTRHLVRLPSAPLRGIAEPDGTLLVPTRDGVMAVDPTGTPTLLPCAPPSGA
jgi:hypothetical protein